MEHASCDRKAFIPAIISDFVMLVGLNWHRNDEGKFYTQLKGKKIYLDEGTLKEDDVIGSDSVGGIDFFPGIELPLADAQGTPLNNSFAIVPIQYLDWLESIGPWYFDEPSSSIYTQIMNDPPFRVYLRDVIWTLMASDCSDNVVDNPSSPFSSRNT